MEKTFTVLTLDREDFITAGYDASKLDDERMERIAQKLGEMCMGDFWAGLEVLGESFEVPEITA